VVVEVGQLLVELLRQAWVALAAGLAVFATLAMLAQVLRTTLAGALGSGRWAWGAISVGIGLLALTLFAFLGVPAILQAVHVVLPDITGCGPITELAQFAAGLIAGLAGVRMLLAILVSTVLVSLGSSPSLAEALMEAGEATFGMAIVALVLPLAEYLLSSTIHLC
jgi:hypothetical protein